MKPFDALVIGAGPAGGFTAFQLARAGWKIAVVERLPFPRPKVCGEFLSARTLGLLRQAGLEEVVEGCGPRVMRLGLFSGPHAITTRPLGRAALEGWGCALAREDLDTRLLARAAEAGACVWQPWEVRRLHRSPEGWRCELEERMTGGRSMLAARVLIAAHGSWRQGQLPTQPSPRPPRGSDLFAFKARFSQSSLSPDLMPLLVFPGGYGGMVHTSDERVSLSCCLRRDTLQRQRGEQPASSAADAVLNHIQRSCHAVAGALAHAEREDSWVSAGPIRPGIRPRYRDGIFSVGNAAGEAHPLIADGISMAIQGANLLGRLLRSDSNASDPTKLAASGREYALEWSRAFASRIYAARVFAALAMSPAAAGLLRPMVQCFPAILSAGARLGGKQ
jgi:2-polyprenyl-6-methoxyphenol hydroxylase-like FAD-dependent oxidoreductase